MEQFKVLLSYLLPFVLLFIIVIAFVIYFFSTKRPRIAFFILCGLVIIIILVLCLPLPTEFFFKDYNEELNPKDKLINGTWTNVYKHPDNNKIIKQIAAPGVSHCDFAHVKLPTLFTYCSRKSCTLPCMIAHRIATSVMCKSIERIINMNSKFFPKIYEYDKEKRRYVCEKISNELTLETRPIDYETQLQEINRELEKYDYYLDDVHSRNWMVDDNGKLKIVDCEVFTKSELDFQQKLLGKIDDSQDGAAQPHKNASRILHWIDGRPNIETIGNV